MLQLLALSEMSEHDLYSAIRELTDLPLPAAMDTIVALRKAMDDALHDPSMAMGRKRGGYARLDSGPDTGPVDAIERLLREEAGLPVREAADALLAALVKEDPGFQGYPPLGKEGFATWLTRLMRHVPPSRLLHLATRLRNSRVHHRPADWPLS